MNRESLLILIGILIALVPFSGLPTAWLEIILPAFGAVIVAIGYTLRSRRKSAAPLAAEEIHAAA